MKINGWFEGLFKTKPNIKVWQERPPYSEVDALYKTLNCEDHTYYVATKRPRGHGRWSSFGQQVKLSGLGMHRDWMINFEQFFFGNNRWIVFKRDYKNDHDLFATEVYGIWTDRNTERIEKKRIGWVDSSYSEEIAKRIGSNGIIGIPSIFYYGKENSGLRFRVWIDMEEESSRYAQLRNCLLEETGINVKDASEKSGFDKSQIRNWLDKLSMGEVVASSLMEAMSGYRVEKIKVGAKVLYKAIPDITRIFEVKHGMTDKQILDDPMGADVPDYVLNSNV